MEEKRAKQDWAEKRKLILWTDPESDVQVKHEIFYAPERIRNEEAFLSGSKINDQMNFTDYFHFTTYPYEAYFTDPQFHYCAKRIKKYKRVLKTQLFMRDRLKALGPDLSAAHFMLARHCRIKFCHKEDWTELERFGMLPKDIPLTYTPGWHVEAIEASDSLLLYEGLQSLRGLMYLKHLDISYSPYMDSWCLDRISGEYQDTLEYLDLSGCKAVHHNGLEAIWRLRKLKTLVLRDMEHIDDLKLICLMLLEVLPDLEIRGVDYIDTKLLEGTEHQHLLSDSDLFLLTDSQSIKTHQEPSKDIKDEHCSASEIKSESVKADSL